MSGTESARQTGCDQLVLFVYQKEKTYWKGSGRMRVRTFLCRRLDDRVRPPGDGLISVIWFCGEVRFMVGEILNSKEGWLMVVVAIVLCWFALLSLLSCSVLRLVPVSEFLSSGFMDGFSCERQQRVED